MGQNRPRALARTTTATLALAQTLALALVASSFINLQSFDARRRRGEFLFRPWLARPSFFCSRGRDIIKGCRRSRR